MLSLFPSHSVNEVIGCNGTHPSRVKVYPDQAKAKAKILRRFLDRFWTHWSESESESEISWKDYIDSYRSIHTKQKRKRKRKRHRCSFRFRQVWVDLYTYGILYNAPASLDVENAKLKQNLCGNNTASNANLCTIMAH